MIIHLKILKLLISTMLYSNSDEIHVSLRSTADHLPKPRKFVFDVAPSSCNRNYTSEQGRIIHENVGECWTTITAPTNRTISLYFNHFRFYDHGNCSVNFVQVGNCFKFSCTHRRDFRLKLAIEISKNPF